MLYDWKFVICEPLFYLKIRDYTVAYRICKIIKTSQVVYLKKMLSLKKGKHEGGGYADMPV